MFVGGLQGAYRVNVKGDFGLAGWLGGSCFGTPVAMLRAGADGWAGCA